MLLAVRVNLNHFVQDLMAGDPVVWAIALGIVFFSGLGMYQKFRAASTSDVAEAG